MTNVLTVEGYFAISIIYFFFNSWPLIYFLLFSFVFFILSYLGFLSRSFTFFYILFGWLHLFSSVTIGITVTNMFRSLFCFCFFLRKGLIIRLSFLFLFILRCGMLGQLRSLFGKFSFSFLIRSFRFFCLSPHSPRLVFCCLIYFCFNIVCTYDVFISVAIRRDSFFSFESFSHQHQLMVFHCSLSDNKSPQVLGTLLRILADLNRAVSWMISTRPLISNSSCPFTNLWWLYRAHLLHLVSPSLSCSIVFSFP